jgi:cell division protease FtsH
LVEFHRRFAEESNQARAMVTIYGLNDKIGNVTYYDSTGQSEYNFSKPYSEETAKNH